MSDEPIVREVKVTNLVTNKYGTAFVVTCTDDTIWRMGVQGTELIGHSIGLEFLDGPEAVELVKSYPTGTRVGTDGTNEVVFGRYPTRAEAEATHYIKRNDSRTFREGETRFRFYVREARGRVRVSEAKNG